MKDKPQHQGMFHKHATNSSKGQFFKEMPGRDDGRFYEKAANELEGYPEQDIMSGDINGSSGNPGAEAGGGMYGTGDGVAKAAKRARPSLKSLLNIAGPGKTRAAVKVAGAMDDLKAREASGGFKVDPPSGPPASAKPIDPYASKGHKKPPAPKAAPAPAPKAPAWNGKPLDSKFRLQRGEPGSPGDAVASSANDYVDRQQAPTFSTSGPIPRARFGTVQDTVAGSANRKFNELNHVKKGSAAPSDWEADAGLPSGFHRPAHEQPESLESGGNRFHSTMANPPAAGSMSGTRHGIREGGSMSLPVTATSNLGKHAEAKVAFDVEGAKAYGKARLEEAKESLTGGATDLGDMADKAVRGITKSPTGTAIAGLIGLKMLGRGGRGVARGAGRLFGRKPPPKPSMLGSVAGGLRRVLGGK